MGRLTQTLTKHKMKTHYALCDRANESYNHDEWIETLCGYDLENTNYLTDNPKYVDCKKCLAKINNNATTTRNK